MKIYYIVYWDNNCWQPFLQHQIGIMKCYKVKEGFISINDYRENPNDFYYHSDYAYTRKDFCFRAKKEDIFLDIDAAKEYALDKISDMFLSRQKHLLEEFYKAVDKIKRRSK